MMTMKLVHVKNDVVNENVARKNVKRKMHVPKKNARSVQKSERSDSLHWRAKHDQAHQKKNSSNRTTRP
jgi:hypothetical protein